MNRRRFFGYLSGIVLTLGAIYGERFKVFELHLEDEEKTSLKAEGSQSLTGDWIKENEGWIKLFLGEKLEWCPVQL